MYVFLSDEWMEAAREIRARYEADLPEVTVTVRINQVITDVPFGEGTIHAYVDTGDGDVTLELGELDEPDAVLIVDDHTAHAMLVEQNPTVVMQSFLEGRIKVQGDMMKLMAMQTAMPTNEFSMQVAEEFLSITIEPEPPEVDGDEADDEDPGDTDD